MTCEYNGRFASEWPWPWPLPPGGPMWARPPMAITPYRETVDLGSGVGRPMLVRLGERGSTMSGVAETSRERVGRALGVRGFSHLRARGGR